MSFFRSKRFSRWAAYFAVLGLLFQAGMAVWHATAMFALAAGQSDGGAQAAMMCHGGSVSVAGDTSGAADEPDDAPAFVQNCPCCLGLVSAATAAADHGDALVTATALDRFLPAHAAGLASGRHRLAPESRGPPHLV